MTPEDSLHEVVFSVGSNCGDRPSNVANGIKWLQTFISELKTSSIYATPDYHGSGREYYNAVVCGKTSLNPEEIDELCKIHEKECGRTEEARAAGDVPLDIDTVIYNHQILRPKDYSRNFFRIGHDQVMAHTMIKD